MRAGNTDGSDSQRLAGGHREPMPVTPDPKVMGSIPVRPTMDMSVALGGLPVSSSHGQALPLDPDRPQPMAPVQLAR